MSATAARQPALRGSRARLPVQDILDVRVSSFTLEEALGVLRRFLAERVFTPVAFLNAHGSNLARRDRRFAAALNRFLVLPDGIGVDLASKLLHGRPFPANLNGTDFVPALLASISSGLRVGLLGARPENAQGAAAALAELAPQHEYRVIADGFFSAESEPALLAGLAEWRPDILLVAMGMPRQETWIADKIGAAHCTMPIAVGALFDFLSAAVPRAPLVVRRLRLEWLFRLAIEPRRLWRRYLLGNPAFIGRVIGAKLFGERRP